MSGPCVGYINENYISTVSDAIDFISGKSRRIQKTYLKKWNSDKELDYERAAIARDRIKALTQIQTSQK